MLQEKHHWASVIILAGLIAVGTGIWPARDCRGQASTGGDTTSNRVDGVHRFRRDLASGSLAIYALQSSLEALGFKHSYGKLAGRAGMTFKFVYDTTEAYEPLRDLFPSDALQLAADQMGFRQARWETGHSMEEVVRIIRREIDAGRSLIAPNLKMDAYHGFCIITGYDLETGYLLIQGAFREEGYDSIPIPQRWDGPTASPLGWASNPVFVFGERGMAGEAQAGKYSRAVEAGIEIMRGGEITYGRHPGEEAFMGEPGPHTAGYGLMAFDLLASDVASRPLVTMRDGQADLDFGFMWRIDAQVGQFYRDRTQGATFLRSLRSGLPQEKIPLLEETTRTFELTARDAKHLKSIFWQVMPVTVVSADSAVAYARNSPSIVLMIPGRGGLADELKARGEGVFETSWGWVIIADSPEKRMEARLLVRGILSRERNSLRMLEELLPAVDTRLELDRPEGQRGPRRD